MLFFEKIGAAAVTEEQTGRLDGTLARTQPQADRVAQMDILSATLIGVRGVCVSAPRLFQVNNARSARLVYTTQ